MCLLVAAWKVHPDHLLVLAGNRDEFHARPTAPAGWWDESQGILGGRDLGAGGAWLAVNRRHRLAVVTNFREASRTAEDRPSRGGLVVDALIHEGPIEGWVAELERRNRDYAGFNLVVRDGDAIHVLSNRGEDQLDLPPGIYGLSNHLLDTPWPKVEIARRAMRHAVEGSRVDVDSLFEMLGDCRQAPDDALPDTGVPLDWERVLSAVFISGADYGTRASTVVTVGIDGSTRFEERRFGPSGEARGQTRIEL